jgi:hypothetical protein
MQYRRKVSLALEEVALGLVSKLQFEHLDTAVKQPTDYYINVATCSIGLMKKVLNQSLSSNLQVLEMGKSHQTGIRTIEGVKHFTKTQTRI